MSPSASHPNQAANVSIHSNPLSLVAWASAFFMLILTIPALSVVVFLRTRFGCRFLKLWMVFVALGVLWTLYSVPLSTPYGPQGFSMTSASPARLFAVAMMVLAVYHSRTAWKRFWSAAGNPRLLWHSMNDGTPRLRRMFPRVGERLLKTVLEPGAVAGVGFVCMFIASYNTRSEGIFRGGFMNLALWLFTAAVAHALYETMLYEQRLNSFIDFVDQNIEAASLQAVGDDYMDRRVPTREDTLGNPVLFTPELFQIMESARQTSDGRKAASAAAQ
jgi:hypothetical protein